MRWWVRYRERLERWLWLVVGGLGGCWKFINFDNLTLISSHFYQKWSFYLGFILEKKILPTLTKLIYYYLSFLNLQLFIIIGNITQILNIQPNASYAESDKSSKIYMIQNKIV